MGTSIDTVVVIGGGMAGLRSAEGVRAAGHTGRIVMVSDEPHLAYDRPPLSKGFIVGDIDQTGLTFATEARLAEQGIEVVTARAVAIRPEEHEVVLDHGVLSFDRAVIATGSAARPVPGIAPDRQPPVLRTLDDAVHLRERLGSARSVVVIGGGLIGCEIAATSRAMGLDVTLVEAGPTLMLRSLGAQLGGLAEALHRDRGVRVLTGVGAVEIDPPAAHGGGWSVALSDDQTLAADVVVAGIGATASVDWVRGSGIEVDDGVVCDASLTTSHDDVMAAGDVVRFSDADGVLRRHEQWLSALDQAQHVARNILLPRAERAPFATAGYFWSDQFGLKLQGVGSHEDAELVFDAVDPDEHTYLVRAVREGRVVGVFASGHVREFGRLRRSIGTPVT